MADDADTDRVAGGEGLGATLTAAREAKGLTVEKAAADLHLRPELIRKLEANQLSELGAPVFVKGYLRQYALLLGLETDRVTALYTQAGGPEESPVVGKKPVRLRDDQQVAIWGAAGLIAFLGAIATLIWWQTGPDPEPEVAVPEAIVEDLETIATDETEMVAGAETAVEAQAPPEVEPEQVAQPAPNTPTGPKIFQVEMSFSQDSWAEVTDANGQRLFYGLGRAGARSRFSSEAPISFLLGNADGVALAVDGAPYPVPREGRQGNLARFVVLAEE